MDQDDDHTPPDRQPAFAAAFDSGVRRRARTPPTVAPAIDGHDVNAADETLGSLGRVVDAIIERRTARKLRGFKAGIVTAIVTAIGTLVGGIKGSLDAREAAGVDKARLHQLEVEVDRLRSAVFPAPPPYWRRDDAPFPTAPQMRAPDPTQRGPLP